MSQLAAQEEAIVSGVLIRPRPDFETLVVTGPERQSWLAGMLTADVKALAVGQGCYALSVSRTGKIQAEVWVVVDGEQILLAVPSGLADTLRGQLEELLIMEDAEIEKAKVRYVWWFGYGPKAEAMVAAAGKVNAVAATAQLGELTMAIVVDVHGSEPSMGDVMSGIGEAVIATPAAWERIRIAQLLPTFGVDFELGQFPQEARLEKLAVSFNKGCYVGQEAVFMLEKRGRAKKRLARLQVDGSAPLEKGSEVLTAESEAIGAITSMAVSGDAVQAWAMLRAPHGSEGTELTVAGRAARVTSP